MSVLDQPNEWIRIDPMAMRTHLEEFPDQVRSAFLSVSESDIPCPARIESVVVCGLGGSAIGGDLARSIAGEDLKKPFAVHRDYGIPPFAGESTLIIACSYSGNTEETLSAYDQARQVKATRVCITSGGELESRAQEDGCCIIPLPQGLPPRAALGHSLFSLLGVMQAMQLVPDMAVSVRETVDLLKALKLKYGFQKPLSENIAKEIAQSLHGKIAAIYGSDAIMGSTALRWRSQIEENAKTLALHHSLPEMNHNELVGWLCPEAVLARVGVVFLRDMWDHPQVQRRFELTKEIISGKAGSIREVWSEGDSRLARVLSLIYLGDYVSLYLAYLNSIDPTPVDVIDYLKRELGGGAKV